MYQKLKSFITFEPVFVSLLLCLVAILAFYLGRISVNTASSDKGVTLVATTSLIRSNSQAATITNSDTGVTPAVDATANTSQGAFVASKSGTKYHLTTCPGAKQIKPDNKIYFATRDEAEAAGYSKASNCPGL